MSLGDETILQVNTGQAWHLHISDETRCIGQRLGLKKVLCRTKRGSAI